MVSRRCGGWLWDKTTFGSCLHSQATNGKGLGQRHLFRMNCSQKSQGLQIRNVVSIGMKVKHLKARNE